MNVSPHALATQEDESQLKLLSTLHYVLAGLSAFFSSFFIFHIAWGVSIWRRVPLFPGPAHAGPPVPFGIMITLMGTAAVIVGWAFAGCLIIAGRSLVARTRYTFCLAIAGMACVLCNPLGMGLGIFTIIVLLRPSVKRIFGVP